ncbi:MAG TPA: haloacid dehalogenase type II [Bryobacteraceae bacterium]|nr:haloacid dehalogenase type II [Bryobacteraceae bacterium]
MPEPRAYLFDAYGTLLDVHAVIGRAGAEIGGDLAALSELWRRKQLEYTWLRSLMERYEDFRKVTEEALRAAAAQLGIALAAGRFEKLIEAYMVAPAFADAKPALERLRGKPLAILSNGSPAMLAAALQHNGLEAYFAEIISADRVRTYKPSPRVYALGTEALELEAGEILFVSSNAWDASGAKSFGYRVCWCNRANARWEIGPPPDSIVPSLDRLA